jgi:hypothetical protein
MRTGIERSPLLRVLAAALATLAALLCFFAALDTPAYGGRELKNFSSRNASAEISIGSVPSCTAEVTGSWIGTLEFRAVDRRGHERNANAQTNEGTNVGATTRQDGVFIWRAPDIRSCRLIMTSYRGGNAMVALEPSNRPPEVVAQLTPHYLGKL